MRIKGTALLARKAVITERFGENVWTQLLVDLATRFPAFSQPVLATSLVPLTEFLALHDELVSRFYGGQSRSYVTLGEQSVRWAITNGPYKSFIIDKNFQTFAEFFPRTWNTYFVETTSYCSTKVEGASVDFSAFDLPLWHPYFEYFVIGYFKGALEHVCNNTIHVKQMQGGSGSEYHYKLWMGMPR